MPQLILILFYFFKSLQEFQESCGFRIFLEFESFLLKQNVVFYFICSKFCRNLPIASSLKLNFSQLKQCQLKIVQIVLLIYFAGQLYLFILYPSVIFIIIIHMTENEDKPQAQGHRESKPEGKKQKSSGGKSSNVNLFVNILLIVAIGLVLYSSQNYRESLSLTREILGKKEIKEVKESSRSSEPIKTAQDKKNVMCPNAKAELESCLEKREKCYKTQKQFEDAERQFTQLISDCAISNDENERLNNQMEKDIQLMQNNLLEAQQQQM